MSFQKPVQKLGLRIDLVQLGAYISFIDPYSAPTTNELYQAFRNEKRKICDLVRKITQDPEFKNLSEPGKTHRDFLVKWEKFQNFTKDMGYSWYENGSGRVNAELYCREVKEAHELWALIEDVTVKKGVWWGQQASDLKTATKTIPARPERRR